MERIVTKQIKLTDYVKKRMADKLDKLEKFIPNHHTLDTTVLVTKEREDYIVEIKCDLGKVEFIGKEREKESLKAFDEAFHKLESQLHKYKEKLVGKHH